MKGQPVDRRQWTETDRPGEFIAVSAPLAGVRVMSVTGSDRHWSELHEVHTICLVHPGQRQVGAKWRSGRSSEFLTGPGEVMVMELGEFHKTTRVLGKAAFSVVQIEPRLVSGMADELELKGSRRVRPLSTDSAALSAAVARFVSKTATGADSLDLECDLVELVCDLWKTCGDLQIKMDPVVHRGIRRARDAIRELFEMPNDSADPPRLEELARISGLGPSRFSHAFRKWVGMSPHAYLNLCRLSSGRRMLEKGTSVTDVAVTLGFADLPHFSRHFRRQFGIPPKKWRVAAGAG